jgi:hypothetical protein
MSEVLERLTLDHFDRIIADAGRVGPGHGSLKDGYRAGDFVLFVRHISVYLLKPHGLYLQLTKLEKWNMKKLMELTVKTRAGRVFVLFGMAGSTDRVSALVNQVKKCMKHRATLKYVYSDNLMSKTFWRSKTFFSAHAICVRYDQHGHGVIDDPAKKTYYPMTQLSLFQCLAYETAVFEMKIRFL